MLRDFDIFERFPDGSTLWRACVFGEYETRRKLQDLAEHSENEFYAVDIRSGAPLPFNLGGGISRPQSKNAAKQVA
jgi:hypothetical protein